jgi:hypothetical protein
MRAVVGTVFAELPPRGALAFAPADPAENAAAPVAGTLAVTARRVTCTYRVEEFPADGGRGFLLVKLTAGSDRAETQYALFCGAGAAPNCECKGFVRWGRCKHAAAVGVCLANGWL